VGETVRETHSARDGGRDGEGDTQCERRRECTWACQWESSVAGTTTSVAADRYTFVAAAKRGLLAAAAAYGDEKVANREIRVWHGATENGP
jgi:hypothetical protein